MILLIHSRVLPTIEDSRTFTFLEVSLTRPNKIDVDLDMLTNEFLAQELPGFLRIMSLLGVGESECDVRSFKHKNECRACTLVLLLSSVAICVPYRHPSQRLKLGRRSTHGQQLHQKLEVVRCLLCHPLWQLQK
jgi:hypothetical protein